jgi:hypothetical protein
MCSTNFCHHLVHDPLHETSFSFGPTILPRSVRVRDVAEDQLPVHEVREGGFEFWPTVRNNDFWRAEDTEP